MNNRQNFTYSIMFLTFLIVVSLGFQVLSFEDLLIPMAVTLIYFTGIFIVAQRLINNSIVDIGWGMGFVVGAVSTLVVTPEPTLLSYIMVGFIAVWGVRLSIRLFRRNWGKPEDFRYAKWRKDWGENVVITAFFRVFMLQGLINYVVGLASYTTIRFNQFDGTGLSLLWVSLGLGLAFIGLFFEVVGDEQLRQHIQKKSKTLLQSGLWSITRHPNYFGEILIWVGLYLVGFSLIETASIGLLFYASLVISPLIMSLVLIKISTPLLEEHMKKYDGWEAYAQKVPMIFPFTKAK